MKEKVTIVSSPHERPKNQSIKEAPQTLEEFYQIVNNAEWPELKSYGFRKWDTLSNLISENIQHKNDPTIISIPTYELDQIVDVISDKPVQPSGNMLYDLGSKEKLPMKLPTEDLDILLFPGEWYNIIPDGFEIIGLNGEKYPFQKGKSDDDIRFGCLPYGITRPISLSTIAKP